MRSQGLLLLLVGPTLGEELVCGQAGRKRKVPGGSGGSTGVRLDTVHVNVHLWCLLAEPAVFQAVRGAGDAGTGGSRRPGFCLQELPG